MRPPLDRSKWVLAPPCDDGFGFLTMIALCAWRKVLYSTASISALTPGTRRPAYEEAIDGAVAPRVATIGGSFPPRVLCLTSS